jgi:superfamily II DNA or RNA helicase
MERKQSINNDVDARKAEGGDMSGVGPGLSVDEYQEYINAKMMTADAVGFDAPELHPDLFGYQVDIVRWALKRGRAAIFADCGMGKTFMQLEWARRVCDHSGGRVLILCPLAVAEQTVAEAAQFGIDATVSRDGIVRSRITITNYENMHRFDLGDFAGLVLDESSIIKSYDGKTRTEILRQSVEVHYRLACTATPAPNDHIELGNHAQFCGIMSREEMLATYFIHDTSGGTNAWRLKGHGASAFWDWVATWAVSIRKPSDIGHSDDGFVLPPLNVIDHMIKVDHSSAADGMLFRMQALSLSELRAEARLTRPLRVAETAALVNGTTDPWIVWCHTNAESSELVAAIDGAVEIKGSDKPDIKAGRMLGFSRGEFRVLVTKPSIAGFGMNWQHCHNVAFVGLTHSYEQFYQAVRRCWRFGQDCPVDVHVMVAETEQSVLRSIQSKQQAADTMAEQMTAAMRDASMENVRGASAMRDTYQTGADIGENHALYLGDCVEVYRDHVETESVGMSVFSPPFASLFTYSNSARDMGNCENDEDFTRHFGFMVDELMRVTIPGRICAVHCMNLPTSKARDGFIGIRDFRGSIIDLFTSKGWVYHSEVTIWKDPVMAMQRTKAHGLLYKTLCKDSSKSRQGLPDYLVMFRKPGNADPVSDGDERFSEYVGTEPPTSSQELDPRRYSIDVWQRYASPVWHDINQSRTLNYREGRQDEDERHICPLQLDVIERAIHLWSNPGDLVATPFAGIGSELVSALNMGRRAVGSELKKSYWDLAKKNIAAAIEPDIQRSLFGD